MAKRLTNQECIEKLKSIYGDSLDYSKVEYKSSRSYITLICPIHGKFQQYANNALLGRGGCPKCKLTFATKEEFVEKAREVHGDKYDYSKVEFQNASTPVTIICPKHGEFKQTPRHHAIGGHGCAKCYYESKTTNSPKKVLTLEEKAIIRRDKWIKECSFIHNNKFDYSLVKPIYNLKDKVTIVCPKHGNFEQSASSHKLHGCAKCSCEQRGQIQMLSFTEFKERATKVHNNKYEYFEYKGMHEKVKIKCVEHGYFKMTPSNHLRGYGCPLCHASRGELLINNILESLNVSFEKQVNIRMNEIVKNSNLVIIDFVVNLPNKCLFIEYNGIQHYLYVPYFHKGGEIDFEKQLHRDAVVRDYCLENNIELLEIPYNLSDKSIQNLIKSIINESKETSGLS